MDHTASTTGVPAALLQLYFELELLALVAILTFKQVVAYGWQCGN
jgi:hypothetical protein